MGGADGADEELAGALSFGVAGVSAFADGAAEVDSDEDGLLLAA
ncbi:MAG: hypothetical protein ABR905_13200 [Terracidiphilus sp.]